MDNWQVIQQLWLRTPLQLILAWVIFMLRNNTPSAQVIHHRIYTLNPSQDTFLQGSGLPYYQADYLEVGVRENGLASGQESRILLKFDIEKFKEDSHWRKEHNFNRLNQTILTTATLTLYCLSVYDSAGTGVDVYSDNILVARVLKTWDQEQTTESKRNYAGELWSEPNLATDGKDATVPLQNITVSVDSQTCSDGDSFTFNMTEIFKDWLAGTVENHGILLWARNKANTRIVLRLASSDNSQLEQHPVLEVQLEDIIIKSGVCPNKELQCVDGTCIEQFKVCNFVDDCLHRTDEEQCGVYCDFESPCIWMTSNTSDSVPGWQVNIGQTLTPNTGPSGGYTDNGFDVSSHYIFVEATGKTNGAASNLVSPIYAESGPQCQLHFQYHMYGADMGSLAIILKYQGEHKVIWKLKGNQRNRWLGDVIQVGRLQGPFQLVFEALRGNGDEGDMAIDSIRLIDCSPELPSRKCRPNQFQCSNLACIDADLVCDLRKDCLLGSDENATMCSVIPLGGACSFEDGWCQWRDVVGEDNFNWTRHKGATPTLNTGPSIDHTLSTDQGYYMFIETSRLPNYHEAYLRSRWFDPPPPETYNRTSVYYQTCKVRFAYHMYGNNIGPIKLYLIQNASGATSQLFHETYGDEDIWLTESISLPTVTQRYYLQFEGGRNRGYLGDAALDDISLSMQCFHIPKSVTTPTTFEPPTELAETTQSQTLYAETTYSTDPIIVVSNGTHFDFSSCGANGRQGPNQQQCDASYRYENLVVTVLKGKMAGVQLWIVPETGPYSITAKGAKGGTGVENQGPSYGAMVQATFNLTAGDMLYILVGQEGDNACDSNGLHVGDVCDGQLEDQIRQQYGTGGIYAGGGGGGGGASFVAKQDAVSGTLVPLLVAAGGGGLSFSQVPPQNRTSVNGRVGNPGTGKFGKHGNGIDVAGAGGGWNGSSTLSATGLSFLSGGKGGIQCYKAHSVSQWDTEGGFGGGGGGCTTGGGGGGYTGGDALFIKELEGNGEGGTSFIHESGLYDVKKANAIGPSQVSIVASVICPDQLAVSADKQTCVVVTVLPPLKQPMSVAVIVGSIVPIIILVILIIVLLLLVYCRKSKQLKDAEQRMNTADFRLSELRQSAANVDFNPCYSLGDGSVKASDLKEIIRENLTLTSALGQGAFGEVYSGLLKSTEEKEPIHVAVKTLPETATDSDEQDFLMEALIMGNFNHPNIVSLIGVSFCQHPRFILLEFMAGGELKVFLRQSRPLDDKPSPLQMVDLLQIALDVSRGCKYLESRHFIHRDIAARNVLLSSKESGRVAKIGDFGMARDIYRSDYYKKGGQALLPVKWMPPEAFMDGVFTIKTDIWAFGILLWEIMSLGFMPYPGMSNHEVIQFVTKGDRMNPPRYCPTSIQNMMSRCWRHFPEERPSFSSIHNKLMQSLQDPDIIKTVLPLHMTEMNHSRPSIVRPHDPKTSPLLRVEDPSSSPVVVRRIANSTPKRDDNSQVEKNDNSQVEKDDIPQCDINANDKRQAEADLPGLRVKIPPPVEKNSSRRESNPISPSQYANPSYSYNTPTPDINPINPFTFSVNDNDSASEKTDLISRDKDDNVNVLDRKSPLRASKETTSSKRNSLKVFLRQSSKDTDSSCGSSHSPVPTTFGFFNQGSPEQSQQRIKDDTHVDTLPIANSKAGKDKVKNNHSPARVLRYNTTDGCILFEEDGGEIV